MAVSLVHERQLWDAGAQVVAGIDEVGRGALAGPVSVGICALSPCDEWPMGLADSKQLTPAKRRAMVSALESFGVARAVGHASAREIDSHGIVSALRIAALRALAEIASQGVSVDAVLLDGKHDWLTAPPADLFSESSDTASAPVTMVIKGDTLCASIAAGSVLAKVERDAVMARAHLDHPEYGWESNAGYGAAGHLEALRALGPTPMHRISWKLPERADGAPDAHAG